MDWPSFLTGAGAIPVIAGLSAWLGKIWANRILEQDRTKYHTQVETLLQDLRTRDSKELFVHQLQFEKEFEIYKELWAKVLVLGRAGKHFRDLQMGPIKPGEQVKSDFCNAYNALSELVYSNRPFYAPAIYKVCKMLLDTSANVSRAIYKQGLLEKRGGESDKTVEKLIELDEKKEGDLDKINDLVGDICEAIHARIWSTDKKDWDRNRT